MDADPLGHELACVSKNRGLRAAAFFGAPLVGANVVVYQGLNADVGGLEPCSEAQGRSCMAAWPHGRSTQAEKLADRPRQRHALLSARSCPSLQRSLQKTALDNKAHASRTRKDRGAKAGRGLASTPSVAAPPSLRE